MEDELAGAASARLTRALSGWQHWRDPPPHAPVAVTRMLASSNSAWLISAGAHWRAVLRLNDDNSVYGVDRAVEHRVLLLLEHSRFTPGVHWSDPAGDHVVTHHVEADDRPFDTARAAALLAQVHTIDAGADIPELDLHDHIERYIAHACERAPGVRADVEAAWQRLQQLPDDADIPTRLCHVDPHPGNFIWRRGGEPLIVDWEYARRTDPLWDLAVLMETGARDGSAAAAARLLAGYPGPIEGTPAQAAERLQRQRLRYGFVDALWWFIRAGETPRGRLALDRLGQRLQAEIVAD